MSHNLRYFRSSIIIAVLGVIAAYLIGRWDAVFVAVILSVLEVSLSFDNAIINAKVLKDMDEVWRKRFITWGMLIAVFGMRLVFPVLIVSIVSGFWPWTAFSLAINEPEQYAHALESAHIVISGFGGGFLLMVFLRFFFDRDKDFHWIHFIERNLVRFGRLESFEIIFALLVTMLFARMLPVEESHQFLVAGIFGIVGYLIVKGLEGLLQRSRHETSEVVKSGLATFIYLEILDASFSFDGVIGAFALSNNIYIIMIGLGVGAMFVRSLTLFFVGHGTLTKFVYLEHGAFWAIGVLAFIMYFSTIREVPDVITGLLGGALIAASLWASLNYNKRQAQDALDTLP